MPQTDDKSLKAHGRPPKEYEVCMRSGKATVLTSVLRSTLSANDELMISHRQFLCPESWPQPTDHAQRHGTDLLIKTPRAR